MVQYRSPDLIRIHGDNFIWHESLNEIVAMLIAAISLMNQHSLKKYEQRCNSATFF